MKITVLKWDEYQPRKDVKKSSWFRMEHAIALSTKYLALTICDIMSLVYVLSLCSEENSKTVQIVPEHLAIFGRLKPDQFFECIEKLQTIGLVRVENTYTLREKHARVSLRTNEQDERTNINTSSGSSDPGPIQPLLLEVQEQPAGKEEELPELAKIWNQHAGPQFPRVQRCGASRKKAIKALWKTQPNAAFWVGIVNAMNESDFLSGRVKEFKADFDWILKDANVDKILEGKYSNRAPAKIVNSVVEEINAR